MSEIDFTTDTPEPKKLFKSSKDIGRGYALFAIVSAFCIVTGWVVYNSTADVMSEIVTPLITALISALNFLIGHYFGKQQGRAEGNQG